MSANDGGDPIVLRKEPVERPVIIRGWYAIELQAHEKPVKGQPFTFTGRRDGFLVTFHDVIVDDVTPPYAQIYVGENTVVTWEKVSAE